MLRVVLMLIVLVAIIRMGWWVIVELVCEAERHGEL
jgi:hypothetical protein